MLPFIHVLLSGLILSISALSACKKRQFNPQPGGLKSQSEAVGTHIQEFTSYDFTFDPSIAVGFADLLALADEKAVGSLDDLLFAMSQNPRFSPMLQNPVLVPHSRSKEAGSVTPSKPRVILSGGYLFLGIIGDETNEEFGQRMEILEFDPKSTRYLPRVLSYKSGRREVDEDPTGCASCHGNPVRPIWGNYNQWAGSYGAHNDLTDAAGRPGEYEQLRGFVCNELPKGRFSKLKFDPQYVAMGSIGKLCDKTTSPTLRVPGDANFRLGQHVSLFNFFRAQYQLSSSARLDQHRPVLNAVFKKCPNIPSFFPDEREAQSQWTSLADRFAKAHLKKMVMDNAFDAEKFPGSNRPLHPHTGLDTLARVTSAYSSSLDLRFVAERMGLDPASWTSDFWPGRGSDTFDFVVNPGDGDNADVFEYLVNRFDIGMEGKESYKMSCDALKAESLKALE
jgi:hypothetical protein